MGNQLVALAPSQIFPVEHYIQDIQDLVTQETASLGSTRFFKVGEGHNRHQGEDWRLAGECAVGGEVQHGSRAGGCQGLCDPRPFLGDEEVSGEGARAAPTAPTNI